MFETETLTPMHLRALRAAVRASAPRPAAAQRAAKDFDQDLRPAVRTEIRWAPYALYYVADPIRGVEHRLFWRQLPASIGPVPPPKT
jgi:hypothetical protein